MPTHRIHYRISGQKKEVLWQPLSDEVDMFDLARWLMSQEFPKQLYRIDKGMQAVLREYGFTDIRSPIPLEWPRHRRFDW
jgi:hypothetical protein